MEAHSFNGLHCASIRQDTLRSLRTRQEVERTDPGVFYLIMQIEGRTRLAQMRDEVVLHPGEMTLIDSGRPCSFHYDRSSLQYSLHIPRGLLERPGRRVALPLARPVTGMSLGILAATLRAAFEAGPGCNPAEAGAVREALLGLATAMLLGREEPTDEPATLDRLHRWLEARLGDPALSPELAAGANGLSARQLHRLFARAGESMGEWLRRRRLEECAAALRDPAQAGCGIGEIAFAWGFSDAAHFSRAFRAAYGMSPRDWRLTPLVKDGVAAGQEASAHLA